MGAVSGISVDDYELFNEIKSALRLQELVKEQLKFNQFEYENGAKTTVPEHKKLLDFETQLLERLLEQSKNTSGVKGK